MSTNVNVINEELVLNVPNPTDVIEVNDNITLNILDLNPTFTVDNELITLDVESGGLVPSGTTDLTYTAGTALSALRAVTLNNSSQAVYATNTTLANAQVLGVTVTAANSGSPVQVRTIGIMTDNSWNWTKGPIYLGSNGALTQIAPTGGLVVAQIGRALSTTIIYIDVDQTITTV